MASKTNNTRNDRNRKRPVNTDGFLEALRELGGDVADSMVRLPGNIAQEAFSQINGNKSGDLKPNQTLELNQIKNSSEQKEVQTAAFQQEFLDIRRQEKIIWTKKQQETELQIKALISELKKLAQTTTELAKEVKIAAQQIPVEPGTYHISFFEKLRSTILLFKQHIEQAANWLSASNQRAKKRNYYWRQFRKSGTKFMLSQERYMATQAG